MSTDFIRIIIKEARLTDATRRSRPCRARFTLAGPTIHACAGAAAKELATIYTCISSPLQIIGASADARTCSTAATGAMARASTTSRAELAGKGHFGFYVIGGCIAIVRRLL